MNNYTVTSKGARKYTLLRDESIRGEIEYRKWSSSKANMFVSGGADYTVAPKGVWHRSTQIMQNGVPIMEFRPSFRKGLMITSLIDATAPTYRLKHKGFWKSGYELIDEAGEQQLFIEASFKWKGFRTGFTISPSIVFERSNRKELLMLVCILAINHQRKMAAVVAAT